MDRKEEIINATLKLASKNGLRSVSMSQIASEIGIKKSSLYNHFKSKENLIKEMYEYIRNKSKENLPHIDLDIKNKNTKEILTEAVLNYKKIVSDEDMLMFYKVIYTERSIDKTAAQILVLETRKMINATKELFYLLQKYNKLNIDNIDIAAISFAMTVHSLIDFEFDSDIADEEFDECIYEDYVEYFLKNKGV